MNYVKIDPYLHLAIEESVSEKEWFNIFLTTDYPKDPYEMELLGLHGGDGRVYIGALQASEIKTLSLEPWVVFIAPSRTSLHPQI